MGLSYVPLANELRPLTLENPVSKLNASGMVGSRPKNSFISVSNRSGYLTNSSNYRGHKGDGSEYTDVYASSSQLCSDHRTVEITGRSWSWLRAVYACDSHCIEARYKHPFTPCTRT